MPTLVKLTNLSASYGGACTCNDARVQGPAGKTSETTLLAGQETTWNLSELGWDSYIKQGFEVAAICSGCSGTRHSKTFT